MKGILIDPHARTITEVSDVPDSIDGIYAAICANTFQAIKLADDETLWVDDEGLLNLDEHSRFFVLCGLNGKAAYLLSGRALVLGVDDEGNSRDTKLTLTIIAAIVRFVTDKHQSEAVTLGTALVNSSTVFSQEPGEDLDAMMDRAKSHHDKVVEMTQQAITYCEP